MSKPLPYYPFYVQAFDESATVMDMSLDEVGLYVLALNESWKRGAIPADLKSLALRIRRPFSAVRRAWPKVSAKWEPSDTPGLLINPRQEVERVRAQEKSEQARENVRKRYQNSTGVDTPESSGQDTDAHTPALQRGSESVSSSRSKSKSSKQKPEIYPGQYANREVFWARYWRKEAKQTAFESYRNELISQELHDKAMTGMERQRPVYMAREREHRPQGATWINQHRWEDEMDDEPAMPNLSGSGMTLEEKAAL